MGSGSFRDEVEKRSDATQREGVISQLAEP
jgi:hypothetical protein